MTFGEVEVAAAEGAILAHSVAGIRKGRLIGGDELAAFRSAGVMRVWVARLDPGDVAEDEAARSLAAALEARGLTADTVATGRVNLRASGPAVVAVQTDIVNRVNAADPGLTLATVAPFQRVHAGQMVATVKVIPYAVAGASVDAACSAARGALILHSPKVQSATLIETEIGSALSDKGRRITTARLRQLEVGLGPRCVVPHDIEALAGAIRRAKGELILILTASATSDIGDVAPAALLAAGGRIERFGMPVDPGNLLFLGDFEGRPVIGLPGCARSPALNGADWVLERVICGVPVTGADIAAMGVGGLLKEIPSRPRPREADREA
ncbi:MAG: molybdopterin-binding protein [Shimia sp.]